MVNNAFAESIAVVDNVKLLNQYQGAKDARQRIISIQDELKSKILQIQQGLIEDSKNADDAGKQQLRQTAQTKAQAEKTRYDSILRNISQEVDGEIQTAINSVASRNGYDVVVAKTSVYYGGTDITEQVLQQLK